MCEWDTECGRERRVAVLVEYPLGCGLLSGRGGGGERGVRCCVGVVGVLFVCAVVDGWMSLRSFGGRSFNRATVTRHCG